MTTSVQTGTGKLQYFLARFSMLVTYVRSLVIKAGGRSPPYKHWYINNTQLEASVTYDLRHRVSMIMRITITQICKFVQ